MQLFEMEVVIGMPDNKTEIKRCIVFASSPSYARKKIAERYKENEVLLVTDTGNRDVIEIILF